MLKKYLFSLLILLISSFANADTNYISEGNKDAKIEIIVYESLTCGHCASFHADVYPGLKGNYSEEDPVNPINKYAISKLGGECAVRMYDNSLILRITMCEKPFMHEFAFQDVKTNFIFHEDVAKIIPKILNKKGIFNIGGKTQTVYNFAKRYNKNIKKISAKKIFGKSYPLNQSMNVSKYKKMIK